MHKDIHGVRASERRITVVHAPDERDTELVPRAFVEWLRGIFEETVWQPEGSGEWGRNAEQHSWGSGRSSPVLGSFDQPAGFELQYHLVK